MAAYVLHSVGLYSIAERRGIRHSWLAWLPVGNLWILGSISDQYQYVVKGEVKNRRKVMLILNIAAIVLYFVAIIVGIISAFALANDSAAGSGWGFFLVGLVMFGLIITMNVFMYMSYYDLYRSSCPENAVLFLVLSIVVSVTLPIFVFINRKKDGGMPPKKQPQAEQPVAQLLEESAAEAEEEVETAEGYAQPEEFEA